MKHGLYPKLAWIGISKNRKIYVPYILTCVCMVMMYYIISFLSSNPAVKEMRGGDSIQIILSLGCWVIGIFSVIFLFYTNSFLMRRRKKEFGLYNILGMGKWNLGRILLWESLIVAAISFAGGLFCGILFSKIAELIMSNMLGGTISFGFTVQIGTIGQTLVLYGVIFALIFLNALRQVHLSKPVELMQSTAVGEKPPKANWVLAVLGAAILIFAYYLAVSIQDPLSAFLIFFGAVIMVIIATYLLFVSGSVALCKLLQKKKRYYYKTNHFVSVSSMIYRMKRNGAGLASICILSTMVLVMLSSTACLFIGTESNLRARYPRNIVVETYSMEPQYTEPVHAAIDTALAENGVQDQVQNLLHYRILDVAGYLVEDEISFSQIPTAAGYGNIRSLFIIPLEDYNRIMGTSETLGGNEILLYCTKGSYDYDSMTIEGVGTLQIKKQVEFINNGVDTMQITPSLFLFVPDLNVMETMFDAQADFYGDNRSYKHDYYAFDLDCSDEQQIAVSNDIFDATAQIQGGDEGFPAVSVESAAANRADFYGLNGGLFLLGILLGIVFILGAVLIMYYKQVSEGYEDQNRFEILQKVGMTKREIKKSIKSQVLTVFFLPLITAGVHVAFAFPLISKLLVLLGLTDTALLILVTICSFLLFTLFYVVVYAMTSRVYYTIVSGSKKESA